MFNDKYKFNKLFVLNTLILLVVFVLGGCFAKEVKQAKSNPQAVVVEKKAEVESVKQGEEIDTSDWLTYRNEELGFEVKYPNGWYQIDDTTINASVFASKKPPYANSYYGMIGRSDGPLFVVGSASATDFLAEKGQEIIFEENIEINNIKARKIHTITKYPLNDPDYYVGVYFSYSNANYAIEGALGKKNKEKNEVLFNKFMSSFKFKKQDEDINIGDWLTYGNEGLGFEVKYPNGWKTEKNGDIIYFCSSQLSVCNLIHINIFENPENLSLYDFYFKRNQNKIGVNLFSTADQYIKINVGAGESVKFFHVPDFVMTTIQSINIEKKVYEFVDFGEGQQATGIFDSMIKTFNIL